MRLKYDHPIITAQFSASYPSFLSGKISEFDFLREVDALNDIIDDQTTYSRYALLAPIVGFGVGLIVAYMTQVFDGLVVCALCLVGLDAM